MRKIGFIIFLSIFIFKYAYSEKILFSSYSIKGNWDIWMIDQNGKNLKQLTFSSEDEFYPSATLNGKRIIYLNNKDEMWIVESGKYPKRIDNLPRNIAEAAISPSGNKIAFVAFSFKDRVEDSDIWIFSLKENKAYKLSEQVGIQRYPNWSFNEKTIIYSSAYKMGNGKIIEDLWEIDIDSKFSKRLLSNKSCNIQPCYSPSGNLVAFASDKTGNMEIYIMDKNKGIIKQLTHNKAYDADPCFSPDGSKICFVSTRSGKLDIWIMDKDGKNLRLLTKFPKILIDCRDPNWLW